MIKKDTIDRSAIAVFQYLFFFSRNYCDQPCRANTIYSIIH